MNSTSIALHSGVLFVLAMSLAAPLHGASRNPLPLVSIGRDGRLAYGIDERGNRVPDFSNCGYAGADRAIPETKARVVVEPKPGDSTERVQQAIDYIANLTADSNGLRGAVLLLRGRHEVFGGLRITDSGVVLRGQGMGEDGTVLVAAGLDRRALIRIVGRNDLVARANAVWRITDDCVSVGATGFHLRDAGGLKPGVRIRIIRPSTAAWIEMLGATEFGGGVGGGWKPGSRDLIWDRVIQAVDGNLVTVDAPITTAMETEFGGGRVETYEWPGRVKNVGVENFRLESAFDTSNPKDENHSWCAITMENAADAWVRQVTFEHFAGSAVAIYESCKRVTVQDCLSLSPVSEIGGYRRHTFFTMGQQTLFLRCCAERGRHDFSTGHCASGPNAFVQCEAHDALDDSGSIESWASGVLFDNVQIDGNAITLGFRPGNNAAVGWAAANSVLWQCGASVIRCWNPPGAQNWAFGSWAGFEGDGIWRGSNNFISPDSLYAGQLRDRLGPAAVARLKLRPRPQSEFSNPPLAKAQELAAASHQPAPQLRDYIATASKRDSIPSETGAAERVEDISLRTIRPDLRGSRAAEVGDNEARTSSRQSAIGNRPFDRRVVAKKLAITNGWLTVDGKLLSGGTAGVAWWRGNVRPNEAPRFGLGVTRFVPGRIGPGFTDDLIDVAESLIANGRAALDHNYGLWYDRRRDDHERVRRMNGDVLPPFHEQPFARGGEGAAWDGLSKYDLTKFNPWYWSRLREFAGICDERGLVLFHQNYFQHNILEAGAHWADSPWRSANNVNHTGFPEPPPYAGGKRVFQAELFYDVTNPVRRKLHEGYIRQCLDNFANRGNVVQFTSAEFTGPLDFMRFWLDTISEWERENSGDAGRALNPILFPNGGESDLRVGVEAHRPIIALSATKDVQDAILADAGRSAIVDVIDFRYWWRAGRGEFAPPGGKNLAPRQFERQWRGGRPADTDLARMTSEYRAKVPDKAVICDFDTAGWAFLCAGGSIPRLPKTADVNLLAAIPRMRPWAEASKDGSWALREPGEQMLVYFGGAAELNLSSESGLFRVNAVNTRTGEVTPGEIVKAGAKVRLPSASVVWLKREA